MATKSSILAWRIPWTEEHGRLWSIGWQRAGHDGSYLACMYARLKLILKTGNRNDFFFFLQQLKEIVNSLTTELTRSLANLNELARSLVVPFPPSLPHCKRGLVASFSYSCYYYHRHSPEPLFSSLSLEVEFVN